jgi:NAD-dependent dihydropyrimidine dehydrogenase PreA subunit
MIKPNPHQLGPVPPFAWPPQTFHLMDYFPVGVHPPHLNLEVFLNPEKFGVEFRPDTMIICHSNPIWAMQGPREKWFEFMKSMKFIAVSDLIPTETTQWADVILPSHDMFESWNMTMIEPPHTEGMCMRQPARGAALRHEERRGDLLRAGRAHRCARQLQRSDELSRSASCRSPNSSCSRASSTRTRRSPGARVLLWNGKDLDWYVEHGHAVTERRLDKWYRPWEGHAPALLHRGHGEGARRSASQKMEAAKVPFRHEWAWDDYQPLPTPRLDPVHEEPRRVRSLRHVLQGHPAQLRREPQQSLDPGHRTYRDPVHIALMLNPKTAEKQGLKALDIVQVNSPYGMIYRPYRRLRGLAPGYAGCIQLAVAGQGQDRRRQACRRTLQRSAALRPQEYRRRDRPAGNGVQGQNHQTAGLAGASEKRAARSMTWWTRSRSRARGGSTDGTLWHGVRPQALHRLQCLRDRLQAGKLAARWRVFHAHPQRGIRRVSGRQPCVHPDAVQSLRGRALARKCARAAPPTRGRTASSWSIPQTCIGCGSCAVACPYDQRSEMKAESFKDGLVRVPAS